MHELENKVAVITGSAGGIGFGIAEAFAELGARIVLTDINEQALATAKEKLEDTYKVKVMALTADGRDEAAVKKTIEMVGKEFGSIDAMINNAQTSKSGVALIDHSYEDFALAIETGLYAAFYYMKYAFPYLKKSRGCVINFASGAGLSGGSGQASYAAAKEGIRGMSRVAAREWGEFGINVNVVCPLAMTKRLEQWKEEFPDAYAKNIQNIPLQRFGDPKQDIGRVCVFLASDAASYISGETISVQGGSGLRP